MAAAAETARGANLAQLAVDLPRRASRDGPHNGVERLERTQPFDLAQTADPGRVVMHRFAYDLALGLREAFRRAARLRTVSSSSVKVTLVIPIPYSHTKAGHTPASRRKRERPAVRYFAVLSAASALRDPARMFLIA